MKAKFNLITFGVLILISMLLVSIKSYALIYTINFTGAGASNTIGSVVVQNLTQGSSVIVPTGNGLTLTDIPNDVDQVFKDEVTVSVYSTPVGYKSIVLVFAKQSGRSQINVYSVDGKMIVGINKNLDAGLNKFQLSVPQGAYAIRISGYGYAYATKFISQVNTAGKPEIDFLGNENEESSISPKNSDFVTLRSSCATTTMLYYEGDRLLYKGIAGDLSTIVTDLPTQSKTVQFNFADCTDADTNHYPVVQIGNQMWMVENLKTTKYNDGSTIPYESDGIAWSNLTTPSYCFYYNAASNKNLYGGLYNWYTVNTGKLAPTGWHVPTDDEWNKLVNYLIANGFNYDGTTTGNKIAKSLAAINGWVPLGTIGNNLTNNNTSGFAGLPCGCRGFSGAFDGVNFAGYWWSSTQDGLGYTCGRSLNYDGSDLGRNYEGKQYGFSVRCVRDDNTPVLEAPILSTTAANDISITSATCGGTITSNGGALITASGVCWNTTGSPTTADSITTDGTLAGPFTSTMNGLTANTTYYVRAYATNSVGTGYGSEVNFTTQSIPEGMVADIDGNLYHTVIIGTQTWLVENLKTTKYNDGTSIPNVTVESTWATLSTPGYCYYSNDILYKSTFGALYNWHTVNTGKLAPKGWHVPTDTEWTTLENYLIANGYNYDGTTTGNKIAKSLAATTAWSTSTNTGAVGNDLTKNNTSGFTAMPGGFRSSDGYFFSLEDFGHWWSSTESSTTKAWFRYLYCKYDFLYRFDSPKGSGYAVRCVRDDNSPVLGTPILSTTAANDITRTSAICGGTITSNGGATITASGVCWNTTESPTTADSKTTDGTLAGPFTSTMNGLTANTTYYVRAYATNSVGTSYGNDLRFKTLSNSVTDIEGNVYGTITIGSQEWMVENLKTTKYNDGTSIPLVSNGTAWSNLTTPAYSWYNNDAANKTIYGALYNWYTINTDNLAPTGWHVPTDAEWITLENYLIANGYNYDGTSTGNKIAKSLAATTGWPTSTNIGTVGNDLTKNNASGFAGLSGGYRHTNGTFYSIGGDGYWWSSTEYNASYAWYRALFYGDSNVYSNYSDKQYGFSVRCVRDVN